MNLLKMLFQFFISEGCDEAHEVTAKKGYRPSRGHVKEINGQFIWVEDYPATDMEKDAEKS